MFSAEPMIELGEDTMSVEMCSHVAADDMLHKFAHNACQRHWSVILRLTSRALLKDWYDPGFEPGWG